MINSLNDLEFEEYRAVIFDCFGTLIETPVRKNPYLYLMKKKNILNKENIQKIMKESVSFAEIGNGLYWRDIELANKMLEEELSAMKIYNDVLPILKRISDKRIKTLVCSNLAVNYKEVLNLIPISEKVLSFEIGFIKPQKEIYELCIHKLGFKSSEILFVGDSYTCDVVGPKNVGMSAIFLNRLKI